MPFARFVAAALSLAVLPTVAAAGPNDNVLKLIDTGEANVLRIVQSEASAHRLDIALSGRDNGAGTSGAWHRPRDLLTGAALAPGTLDQQGFGHTLTLALGGEANLFAAWQTGTGHNLSAEIAGSANQAIVFQTGTGQNAHISQTGTRNSLSIQQGL